MVDKAHIGLLTTVVNQELYRKTARHFPQGIRHYAIDGSNGMHAMHSIRYMMKKLKGLGIEWLIMADEDVLFVDPEAVFDLIEEMQEKGYTVAGIRDGGVIAHRTHNPHLINTFFCVLHFSEIEKIWRWNDVRRQQVPAENEFVRDWTDLSFGYDERSTYEPYYGFFLWLRRKGKRILFLEADHPFIDDAISNSVFYRGKTLLFHTWYARSYGRHDGHTKRIDSIIDRMIHRFGDIGKPVTFYDPFFNMRQHLLKWWKRILNRFCRHGNRVKIIN